MLNALLHGSAALQHLDAANCRGITAAAIVALPAEALRILARCPPRALIFACVRCAVCAGVAQMCGGRERVPELGRRPVRVETGGGCECAAQGSTGVGAAWQDLGRSGAATDGAAAIAAERWGGSLEVLSLAVVRCSALRTPTGL